MQSARVKTRQNTQRVIIHTRQRVIINNMLTIQPGTSTGSYCTKKSNFEPYHIKKNTQHRTVKKCMGGYHLVHHQVRIVQDHSQYLHKILLYLQKHFVVQVVGLICNWRKQCKDIKNLKKTCSYTMVGYWENTKSLFLFSIIFLGWRFDSFELKSSESINYCKLLKL